MARTPVEARVPTLPAQRQVRPAPRKTRAGKTRRPFRFWYLPLLLALLLPLLLWAALNVAVVIFANRDLGMAATQQVAAPTAAPDQRLLEAAISLVQTSSCLPAPSAIQAQPALARAQWTARRSAADSHAYFVAAADPETEHLLGIWQVEGGQVLRLQDDHCPGLPAGPPARLAEAAVLLSPNQLGVGQ